MNGLDLVLVGLVGVLAALGLMKGLSRILIGVVALFLAFFLASRWHEPVAARLGWLDLPGDTERLAGWLVVFLGIVVLGSIAAALVSRLLRVVMLGWADRLAGAALGAGGGLLVAGLLVVPLVAYVSPRSDLLRESTLAPYAATVADVARAVTPETLSDRYRSRIADLRRHWRSA